MNRFAMEYPEDWEAREEAMVDRAEELADVRRDEASAELPPDAEYADPCCVCGEVLTENGRPCGRCEASLEDEKTRP